MWRVKKLPAYDKRWKKLQKKHVGEVRNAIDNAMLYLDFLNRGMRVSQITFNWVHPEPHGVKAFDQSGKGAHKMALRLYAYPDEAEQILYWITMGDKQQQPGDIRDCSEFVAGLLQSRASAQPAPEPETESQRANENENADEESREAGGQAPEGAGEN